MLVGGEWQRADQHRARRSLGVGVRLEVPAECQPAGGRGAGPCPPGAPAAAMRMPSACLRRAFGLGDPCPIPRPRIRKTPYTSTGNLGPSARDPIYRSRNPSSLGSPLPSASTAYVHALLKSARSARSKDPRFRRPRAIAAAYLRRAFGVPLVDAPASGGAHDVWCGAAFQQHGQSC